MTRRVAAALALLACVAASSCRTPYDEQGAPLEPDWTAPLDTRLGPFFEDVTEAVGLDFVHQNGASGSLYIVEVMGPGAALADFDGDGDLDAYLVQGGPLAGEDGADDASRPVDRLFRNDLVRDDLSRDGTEATTGELRFVDVTDEAGLRSDGYGMGVAVGDVDGDGRPDLYVTNFGADTLWLNRSTVEPDGARSLRFVDATEASGLAAIDPESWSVGATFFDADADGALDLFVTGYVDFDPARHRPCRHRSSALDYCGPGVYRPTPDRFLRQVGRVEMPGLGRVPRFVDATGPAGFAVADGPGLGVVALDFDDDGAEDLFVANDAAENQLWIAARDAAPGSGTPLFRDEALLGGCAVNAATEREASMGIASADLDDDGDIDLLLTHLDGESNTLYENRGGTCLDVTRARGLETPSWPYTGFGAGFLDVDHDGRHDLLVVNGAVKRFRETAATSDAARLGQPNQLFMGRADGRFAEVRGPAGPAFAVEEVSRGAAFGDVDGDGDVDVLIANNGGPARLLLNRVGQARPWIGLDVRDALGGAALGARVRVTTAAGARRWFRVARDGSYASASDPRIVVGLGDGLGERDAGRVDVEVFRGGQSVLRLEGLEPGRYHRLDVPAHHTAPNASPYQGDGAGRPSR